MANKYMKKRPPSLPVKEMQIKTTLRFHLTQLEWPYSKAKTTNAGEDAAKQGPFYTVGGNTSYYNHCGKRYGDSSKSHMIQ
jgi:hypothetical protein